MCFTTVEKSVQTASTPLNIFENKGKVESMLIQCAFNNVGRPVQTHGKFGLTGIILYLDNVLVAIPF